MKTKHIKGMDISVLSLGTVQFGLDYGVNNAGGKPDRSVAFGIMDAAVNGGINAFDTAAAYGDSEVVIGEWLKTKDPAAHPFMMTKVNALDHSSLDALRASMRAAVEKGKQRLGLEQLPLLMLHHCDEYLNDKENVTRVFEELKASGDIRYCGVSAYAHHDYREIAASGFDATQIPINLFDWRQIDNGGLKALHDSGMMVFARSVYLQGLVFMQPDQLAPHLSFCQDTLTKFRALCQKYDLAPATLALSFAASRPEITSLVLGCEKVEQVEDNLALFEKVVELTDEQMKEIRDNFADTFEGVLNPTYWNQKKKEAEAASEK